MDVGGAMTEADYPYEASSQPNNCRLDKNKVVVRVTGCYSYNLNSQEKLKQLLFKNGPLSIGMIIILYLLLKNLMIKEYTYLLYLPPYDYGLYRFKKCYLSLR